MGHTHYWSYPPAHPAYRAAWGGLVADTHRILDTVRAAGMRLAGPDGSGTPVDFTRLFRPHWTKLFWLHL